MAEYQKILKCGPALRLAFQNHLLPLAEDLVAVGLISVDNQSEITNVNQPEPNRAGRLLEFIRNKVRLSATYYYTFLEVLKKDEYKHILKILGEHPTEQSTGAQPIATHQQKAVDAHRSRVEVSSGAELRATMQKQQTPSIQQLNAVIDQNKIGEISECMYKWEGKIADALGLNHVAVAAIKKRNPFELTLQTRDALTMWHENRGDNATYGNLIMAFEQAEYRNYADSVKKLASNIPIGNATDPRPSGDGDALLQGPCGNDDTAAQSGHAQAEERIQADDDDQTETPEYDNDFVKQIKKTSGYEKETEEAITKLGFFSDDIVMIVVVNDDEYRAACHYMKPLGCENILTLIKYDTSMTLGTFGGCNAVLVRADMGGDCQENVKEALEEFPNAKAIIAIGVAYGASRKYSFGDVLVSKEIHGFCNVRLNDDGTVNARDPILIHPSKFQKKILDAFTFDTDNWDSLKCTKEGREAKVHTGPMASGSLLFDSVKARDSIVQQIPKMIGGEMEGRRLLEIQRDLQKNSREIGVIVVKGISDFADGVKDKRWQLTAAMAAASYVDKVISINHRLFKPKTFQRAEREK